MDALSLTIAGILTLGIFSFLYKDNPVYKVCEAIFVGVSAGYWAVVYFWDNIHRILWEGIFPPAGTNTEPDYLLLFGAVLGAMMLMRLSKSIGWIARWPLAFIVGATAGLYMMIYFVTNALNQVSSTIMDIISINPDTGHIVWSSTIGTLVITIGVISGLVYFFFSKEHKGLMGGTAKVGIWFLMITFGASFGYTVMSRMSLLIGRVDFIFGDWLGLLK